MPWAHLDIAGPAFAEHDYNAYEKAQRDMESEHC